ncbi:MAG: DUF87 domain-containing protein [Nanoarchaeota archaeon]
MILGKIVGKVTTKEFTFKVESKAEKFQYVQILHDNKYVLAQIIELEKDIEKEIAICNIIGFRDEDILKTLKTPLTPGSEVLQADEKFIKETLNLQKTENSAYIGKLSYYNIDVYLDLNKLLNKHISVLAKSGSGKSFCASVIIEELIEKNIPVLIIDPHGEYSSLKYPSTNKEKLEKFNLKPKSFLKNIQEYSPDISINTECRPLKLSSINISTSELMHLLPAKLNNQQKAILYAALKNMDTIDFNSLIYFLESQESNIKYTLISIIEYLKKLNLFSEESTSLNELIAPGKCTILNLKGIDQEIQEVVVYKLAKDLFTERKKANIPPFFLVLEESHNFIPERSFTEAKSSPILRQIFAEGRKFGLGCCLISQRPSRVDKSALSQVTTQIILKITNPNDIKAVSNSVEGITLETEKEIKNIPVGTALVTGVVDLPLFVNIRPKKTKHGGESISLLDSVKHIPLEKESDQEVFGEAFSQKDSSEILPVIKQKSSVQDLKLIDEKIKSIKSVLIPCAYLTCVKNKEEVHLLTNLNTGELINDFEKGKGKKLDFTLPILSPTQNKVFKTALDLKEFSAAELFSKSGVQFSEIYDIINILINKGLFIKENSSFKLSQKFNINLKDFTCYEKVDYNKIHSDIKLDKKLNPNDVRNFFSCFTLVKNFRECFLETYDIKK